ncbi:hypothetical protein BJ742DRAFT_821061 [Cladochytrium replicatum]|nr:hypothetical protein BJ742DRAFT_821061 [Cladochytrium replicatum]
MADSLGLPLTPTEALAFSQFFKFADKTGNGIITPNASVAFFTKSKLPQPILSEVWKQSAGEKGYLDQGAFYKACKLIALAQSGKQPTVANLSTATPLPAFEGVDITTGVASPLSVNRTGTTIGGPLSVQRTGSTMGTPLVPQMTGGLTPQLTGSGGAFSITPEERERFAQAFQSCSPVDGKITSESARNLFVKSQLPVDQLSSIWFLVDKTGSPYITRTQFFVCMFMITRLRSGIISTVPSTVPQALLTALGGEGSPPISPVQQPRMFPGYSTGGTSDWIITSEDRAQSEKWFDALDAARKGYVTGDEAYGFMLKSNLSETVLADIWSLSDTGKVGRLSREEFGIAMYLIKKKLAGATLPTTLPASLAPKPQSAFDLLSGLSSAPAPSFGGINFSATTAEPAIDLLSDGPALASAPSNPDPFGSASPMFGSARPAASPSFSSAFSSTTPSFGSTPGFGAAATTSSMFSSTGNIIQDLERDVTVRRNELKDASEQAAKIVPMTEEIKQKREELENELRKLTTEKHELTLKMSQARADLEGNRMIVAETEGMLARERQMVEIARRDLENGKRQLDALMMEKQRFDEMSRVNKENIVNYTQQIKNFSETSAGLASDVEKLKAEILDQINLIEINQNQLVEEQKKYQTLQLERQQAQLQLERERTAALDLANQAVAMKAQVAAVERENAQIQVEIANVAAANAAAAAANAVTAASIPKPLDRSPALAHLSPDKAKSLSLSELSAKAGPSGPASPPLPPLSTKPSGSAHHAPSPLSSSIQPTFDVSSQPRLSFDNFNTQIADHVSISSTEALKSPVTIGTDSAPDSATTKGQEDSQFDSAFPDVENFEAQFGKPTDPAPATLSESETIGAVSSPSQKRSRPAPPPPPAARRTGPVSLDAFDIDAELQNAVAAAPDATVLAASVALPLSSATSPLDDLSPAAVSTSGSTQPFQTAVFPADDSAFQFEATFDNAQNGTVAGDGLLSFEDAFSSPAFPTAGAVPATAGVDTDFDAAFGGPLPAATTSSAAFNTAGNFSFDDDPFGPFPPASTGAAPAASAAGSTPFDLDSAFGGTFAPDAAAGLTADAVFGTLTAPIPDVAEESDMEEVKKLMNMGFTKAQAVQALEKHGFDVEKAANELLEGTA